MSDVPDDSPPTPLGRVLIANRGEIAARVIRTCRALGVATVAVHSDADAAAPHVGAADDAVHLPGNAASDTYLDGALLVRAALATGCDAVHPGYGFLAEDPGFAQLVLDAGLVWVGPPPSAMAAMGSKVRAKQLVRTAGVPVLPDSTVEGLEAVGIPALVKASAGGGGRGMRIVRAATDLDDAMSAARREAKAAFGDDTVFVERFVEGGRHVEIQVFADAHGATVSLFERDCTLQRRHQKILEESPSPFVDDELCGRMSAAAVDAARSVGYVGAGTVEFLLEPSGAFWFLEMNTRLQVEHPVTEMVTGLDLVELQLLVAAGGHLPAAALRASRSGHAIEVRLCAEDPANGYLPSSGTFHHVLWPTVTGLRIDSGIRSGSVVSPYYDSMVAKLIAHGPTRSEAARRLHRGLSEAVLIGPTTNRAQLMDLVARLSELDGVPGAIDTTYLDRHPPEPTPLDPAAVAEAALAVAAARPRRALAAVPAGWRNNPAVPQQQRVGDHLVTFGRDRRGQPTDVAVDGVLVTPGSDPSSPSCGVGRSWIVDDRVYVANGLVSLAVPTRYPVPDDAGRAGSLVAPMPGAVLRVHATVGERVAAGAALVTLEAMKMEHTVVAPAAGTVAEVFVVAGQQLDSGQPLVRIDAPPDTSADRDAVSGVGP